MTCKKPSKTAWNIVCVPKKEGGLGVLDLLVHNEALLMKYLQSCTIRRIFIG